MARAMSHAVVGRGVRKVAGGLCVCVAVAGLAACGSSGSNSSAAGAGAGRGGLASRPPAQIVAAAQTALRSARSFVAAGTLRQGKQTVRLQIVEGGGSRLRVQIDEQGKVAEIIATAGVGYVRANRDFWSAQVGALAGRVASRWIQLPASSSRQFSSGLGQFAPTTLARCLGENLGTLSHGPSATVDGRQVVVIRQAGDTPGSNPGTLAVAATGPAYPLRVTSTGPTRPGGKVDACNNGKGGDVQGSLTLRDFDHAPPVTAPRHAVKVSALAGASA